jgi:DHA1 family multidrug resistance protein-like MFS transporter
MARDLILVAISLFTWGLGEGAFLSFQPLYLQQLGADPLRIGAILGGYGLAASLAHIPAGYIADRLGRRPVMWTAWIVGALTIWIMALATSLPVFVIGMLLYSMTSFVIAPLNSYVAAARGNWSVGRVLTLVAASYNAGAVLGPALGGMIGERFGYRTIFLVAAVIIIISTIVILLIRQQPVDAPHPEERGINLLRNNRYVFFVLAYFIATFAMYLPQPLSPNFLQNQRSLGLAQIGQLYSISSLGIVVLNLVLGQINARLGFLIGQVAVGLFALVLWRGNGLIWYGIAYFLLGGFRSARSLATAQIRSIVNQSNMGLAFGMAESVTAFALFLAPSIAGYIYDRDPLKVYALSLAAIAISVVVSAILSSSFSAPQLAKEKFPSKKII